ncbi:hypothetical protein MUP77_00570 [Candidatus Bathyarchaeota archaeon]|nr:hypothetical protein [Candidatus Bathyarchaeota archaeon]
MTIDEAIEFLKDYKMESAFSATPAFENALQLGIEALQGIQRYRQNFNEAYIERLPGETEK